MASLLQLPSNLNSQSQQKQIMTSQLIAMYQQRLKSLIQVSKIYQQTILKDNQQGALAFMQTQEMKKYRIERQLQLLKDTLLIEKQQILIKVLTQYHQLKKNHQQLQKQYSQIQKQHQKLQKQYQQFKTLNIPQKDIQSKTSLEKQSRFTNKLPQKPNDAISRISFLSNPNQINSNTSISLYQKMLQQKMILVKQLQKKNKALKEENEEKSHKINLFQQKLKQTLTQHQSSKQCKACPQHQENIKKLKEQINSLSKQNQQIKANLKKEESKFNQLEKDIQQKIIKITDYQKEIQILKTQLLAFKQKQQTIISKPNKPSPQANLQTIKELKQKLFIQQQQLMALTNSFEFLKQDLNQSLLNEVKRLRTSHKILQQNIKNSINNLKNYMLTFVTQIIETVRIKCQNKKKHEQILKKLRKFDNQLDFFLQQKNIKN